MSVAAGARWGLVALCVAATLGLGGCSTPLQEANARAASDQVVELRAQTPFDVPLARAALAPGKGQIVGTVYAVVNAPKSYDPGATAKVFKEGVDVILYPVTPHLKEYLELRESLGPKRGFFSKRRPPGQYKMVEHPDMLRYRLVTKTDKYGRFAFKDLKPGEYHVTLIYKHLFHSLQNVRTATVSGYYDTAGVYETREFSEPVEQLMFENVTLGSDGASEEISFSKRGTRNFRATQ